MQRDTEYIFGYPPLSRPIVPDEIWGNEAPERQVGFYIHIPFCRSICKYCPFTKYPWRRDDAEAYLKALKREITAVSKKPAMRNAQVTAGFIGGGTPTCLDSLQLKRLLEHARRRLNIASGAEITIEANPGTVDGEMLKMLLSAGVNRISFGVQSFDDRALGMLGCRHNGDMAKRAVSQAFDAGFDNVGVDLLYRLPGQTVNDWRRTLETAVNLKVSHIAIPELSIDRGTPLYRERQDGILPPCPGEMEAVALYAIGCRILKEAGYNHYNLGYDFASPGKECVYHRMNWEAPQREVMGFGTGAYGYVNGAVYLNAPELGDYFRCLGAGDLPVLLGKKLSSAERMARFMVHGVYMVKVSKRRFKDTFGQAMDDVYGDTLRRLAALGWIENNGDHIQLTSEGIIFVNNVSKSFYQDKYSGGIR